MPTLYTMPGTCALAPNIAVAWLDAPITIENLTYGEHQRDAFLAINPKGKVPALRFDDGDVLTEAAAILTWLGAAHGSPRYARETPLGRKEGEALAYLTSEVHADFGPHFAASTYADSESGQDEVKAHAYEKIAGHYAFLENQLASSGAEWLLGDRSFADTYLYVVTRWADLTPVRLSDTPLLLGHRARMEADDGVQKALVRQGMAPLGV